ncbi:uncharacterized protein LOC128224570 [Mya arenaria]|uniref:uncharacterized protein LOC128224570 n=1 Tax=Mya arenaria TaxID=6604 RepID=UPI0022E8F1B2|nr:uncharacterized protein LOC128224570 [Mya arenaria]
MASQTTSPSLDKVIVDQLQTSTYVIELDMFSGRPNPTVVVHERKEHFMKMFADHKSFQSTSLASTLGYRGIIVHKRTSPKGATLETSRLTVGKGNIPELERSLLQMFTDVSKDVIAHVKKCIEAGPQIILDRTAQAGKVTYPGEYRLPNYDPGSWNNDFTTLQKNNCYNYSTNIKTNSFAQPGHCHGGPVLNVAKEVLDGCLKDSLKQRQDGNPPSQAENTGAIALVIWPSQPGSTDPNGCFEDFHFYRMDSNLKWSHKPGGTAVVNTDSSGNLINDPMSANRGPYTYFLSYLGNRPGVNIC